MVFSSPRFFVFLAGLLVVLALIHSRTTKKRVITAASCLFYAAWDWRFLGLLLGISVIDYVAAARIAGTDIPDRRKAWLLLSVVSNLGVLAWFKYANFIIDSSNSLLGRAGMHLPYMDILLPAGISFYTFKTMSYTIDVYRRELEPSRSWLDYAMFITFFPELIAGPIVRASVFLPQMSREPGPTNDRLALGGSIFLQGLTKKVFLADRLATIADPIFASPGQWSTMNVWFGLLAYSLQIYCDFSGYSDMAVGTGKMIGYDLPENFRMPYASTNITEFWRRWHVTLSRWLRDYLYIPLGGNRHGSVATYRNLMLTMLLGGLWHGASWNFVVWGGLHGSALAGHKLWLDLGGRKARIPVPAAWALTQLFVLLTWVPFRSQSFGTTLVLLRKMVGLPHTGGHVWVPVWLGACVTLVVIGHVIGLAIERSAARDLPSRIYAGALSILGACIVRNPISGSYLKPSRLAPVGAYLLTLWLCMLFALAPTTTSPFIYFQF
jgi:alginate O-acetyltransferase complex protein AlgI